jgi:hypothetical protein
VSRDNTYCKDLMKVSDMIGKECIRTCEGDVVGTFEGATVGVIDGPNVGRVVGAPDGT